MKVMYFIEGDGGGAVTHVLNLAKTLPKDLIHPLVVFFLDGPSVQVARDMGLDTRLLSWRFPLDFTLVGRLRNVILKEEIDILHTHTILPSPSPPTPGKLFLLNVPSPTRR